MTVTCCSCCAACVHGPDGPPSCAFHRTPRAVRAPSRSSGSPGRIRLTPHRWWIDSDNAAEGVTSFDVGSLADDDIVAVVVGLVWTPLG